MSGWLPETIAATSVLIALTLWLRRPIGRAFGAQVAYALWALPALRMLLPPLPGVHKLVVPALVIVLPKPGTSGMVEAGLVAPATLPHGHQLLVPGLAPQGLAGLHAAAAPALAAATGPSLDLPSLLLGIWLTGALAVLAWQALSYRRFMRHTLMGATPIGHAAGTTILVGPQVAGPVATGVLRRRILLPADFSRRYSPTEARLVLDHEAAHHDRGDLIANLAALVVLATQWWNPVAWVAHRAFRADQELACDASVTRRLGAAERYAYAQAVSRSAGFDGPAAAAPLSAVATLKRRLAMMGRDRSPMRALTGALLVTAVIGGALVGSASGQAAEQATARHVRAPRAPVAPAAPETPAAPQRLADSTPPPAPAAPPAPVAPIAPDAAPAPEPPMPSAIALQANRAELEAQAAGLKAQAAGLAAQKAALASVARMNVTGIVRTSLEAARSGLEAGCRERGGHPVAGAGLGELADCNAAGASEEVREGLTEARDDIASDPDFDSAEAGPALHAALAEIDRQIATLDHRAH